MKIINRRLVGRYRNQAGKEVNIYKAKKKGYGVDILFYFFKFSPVLISDKDFYDNWKKVEPCF